MRARLNLSPRAEWTPTTRQRDEPRTPRCCAKCRRGVPGFGDLPCGYPDMKCPNNCHQTKETTE